MKIFAILEVRGLPTIWPDTTLCTIQIRAAIKTEGDVIEAHVDRGK